MNLIAEDDDGGGGFNARLELVLPADGEYVIEATRYGQGRLLLLNCALRELLGQPAGNSLSFGYRSAREAQARARFARILAGWAGITPSLRIEPIEVNGVPYPAPLRCRRRPK